MRSILYPFPGSDASCLPILWSGLRTRFEVDPGLLGLDERMRCDQAEESVKLTASVLGQTKKLRVVEASRRSVNRQAEASFGVRGVD